MKVTLTRWPNLHTPQGTREETDWPVFCDEWRRIVKYKGEHMHPGWSPATFAGDKRAAENVERVYALCLDYDSGTTIEEAERLWDSYTGLLHTSRKHTHDSPRFRVVLPLARPVSAFEHAGLWERVNAHAGGKPDPSPKDASRFWYMPGVADHEGACFESRVWDGPLLDPGEWLAKPAPRPDTTTDADLAPRDPTALERRAIAYIAKIPPAISGQGGHKQTWEVALYLAKGFGLSEEATFRILREHYNQRCQPPWKDKELRHKARDATRARVPDGFKLDTDDEWRPRQHMPAQPEPPPDDDPNYVPEPPEELAESEPVREPESSAPVSSPPPRPEKRPAIERYGFLSTRQLIEPVYQAMQNPTPDVGVPTGNEEIDQAIGKFRRGNVTILAAKRAFGKTSFSIAAIDHAQKQGHRVLLFAGEDSAMMYGKRFLALGAHINATRLRDLDVNAQDMAKAVDALAVASTTPFFVRTAGRPAEWIVKVITEVCAEEDVALVAVDYLQCIRAAERQQDRRNEVTYVTRIMTDAIKNANSAGLMLSQLKRTQHDRPDIEDIKESGDVEDMAEHVLLGWKRKNRDESTERILLLGKNKDGPEDMGEILLPFNPDTASFAVRYGYTGTTRAQEPDDYGIDGGYDDRRAGE